MKGHLNRHLFFLAVCLLLSILCFSIFTLNRAFIIGATAGLLFLVLDLKNKNVIDKNLLFKTLLGMGILVYFLVTVVKSDSSLGRILIYKISGKMFTDQPLTGIGLGNFQWKYGLYQARYFTNGGFSDKEFLLAGNTFFAFNDYWQFIVETGLVGAVTMLFVAYLCIKRARFQLKKDKGDTLLRGLIALGITILVAAIFTHVLENIIFQAIIVLVISYLIFPSKLPRQYLSKLTISLFISMIFSCYQYRKQILYFKEYNKLVLAQTLLSTGYILDGRKILDEIYPALDWDIAFLKVYNDALSNEDNLKKKIFLLQQILGQYSDNTCYLKLAISYDAIGNYRDAERAYLISVNMVPNRFLSKEALYNFYIKHKQYRKASVLRFKILNMPIKIPSEQIDMLRKKLKNLDDEH